MPGDPSQARAEYYEVSGVADVLTSVNLRSVRSDNLIIAALERDPSVADAFARVDLQNAATHGGAEESQRQELYAAARPASAAGCAGLGHPFAPAIRRHVADALVRRQRGSKRHPVRVCARMCRMWRMWRTPPHRRQPFWASDPGREPDP
jgi:hypothetical protein